MREGREGDAAREGDKFPDTAAQGGSRNATLDQALGDAFREGLSWYWHGVVLEAEVPEGDRRDVGLTTPATRAKRRRWGAAQRWCRASCLAEFERTLPEEEAN